VFAYVDGPYPYPMVLLLSFLFGIGMGLFYECFRVLRTALGRLENAPYRIIRMVYCALVFAQDLIFFLAMAVCGVLFLYVCNRGQLRLSILLMIASGFCLYLLTLGRLVFRLHSALIGFLYRILRFVYRYTFGVLFRALYFLWQKSFGKWLWKLGKILQEYLLMRKKRRAYRRLDRFAESTKHIEHFPDHAGMP